MNRLRGWLAALIALRWRRALTCLAILIAIPTLFYWLAHGLVWEGVRAALGYVPPSADLSEMTARGLARWSQGWVTPLMVVYTFSSVGLTITCLDPRFAPPPPKPQPRAKTIRTARLVLRRANWEDLDAIHAICSDAENLRLWDRLPYESPEQTRAWLNRILALSPVTSDVFVVEREGRAIGILGSMAVPWVTFLIRRDEWGQGYASEALAAFVGYMAGRGFDELLAATHPDNAAALALLRKTGFVEHARSQGLFRVAGAPGDAVHFKRGPAEDGAQLGAHAHAEQLRDDD